MTTITRNPFHCHGYIINDEQDKVLVVDPGSPANLFMPKVLALKPSSVIIVYTHGHLDHVAYGQALRDGLEATGLNVTSYAPKADSHYFGPHGQQRFQASVDYFGLQAHYQGASVPIIDHFLEEGEALPFEDFVLSLAPGHSPGSSLLTSATRQLIFSGDVLFAGGGAGRTDFEDGDGNAMAMSIRKIFKTIPLAYTLFPGHGASFVLASEQPYHQDLLKD